MRDSEGVRTAQDCPVCFGLHDDEIHDATVTIHLWLRNEIARRTYSEPFVFEDMAAAVIP